MKPSLLASTRLAFVERLGIFLGLLLATTSPRLLAEPTADGLYAGFFTSLGSYWCRLEYKLVPRTVGNFVGLAEGTRSWVDFSSSKIVQRPFFDRLTYHRVIDEFMIQTGSPNGQGTDGPGYEFADEFHATLRHSKPGILSMANSGANRNGSQCFVTVTNTPWLDNKHAVFGEVVEGMEVVYAISKVATGAQDKPVTPVQLNEVRILRKGTEALAFDPAKLAKPLPEVGVVPIALTFTNSSTVTFLATDIADWTPFASSVKTSTYPVSAYLRTRLTAGSRAGMEAWTNTTSPIPSTLVSALVLDLNRIIRGDSIYEAGRFASVNFRPDTAALRLRNPTGTELARLNRMLLEDAYPLELPRISQMFLELKWRENHLQHVFFSPDLVNWDYQTFDGGFDTLDATSLMGYRHMFLHTLDGGYEP